MSSGVGAYKESTSASDVGSLPVLENDIRIFKTTIASLEVHYDNNCV